MDKKIRKIEIEQGKEFQIYVHKDKIKADDVFIQAYEQAATVVDDLVNATNEYHKLSEEEKEGRADFLNNIIAFCGERGQGKSSAMVTFVNELCKVQPAKSDLDFSADAKQAKFYGMDIIDPSTFEDYQDVLEIIVSRMYKKFEKIYKKGDSKLDKYQTKDMIMTFQETYKNIGILRNPKKLQDGDYAFEGDIERLSQLGDSSMFRDTMMRLVKQYLRMVSGHNDPKDMFLVIPIDDLDVSIESAYGIAERIRKYLMIPNVIIVMALKAEQMRYCVEKEFTKQLSELQKTKAEFVCQEAKSMAGKYIDKLIPNGRKVYLPEIKTMDQSGESKVEIVYKNSETGENLLSRKSLGLPTEDKNKKDNEEKDKNKKDKGELGINEAVLSYIYQKTGIVFVKKDGEQHLIVPNNLRELVSLLAVLGEMKTLEEDRQYVENIKKFKEYFIGTWIVNNVNEHYQSIIDEFISLNGKQKHKYICHTVFDKIKELRVNRNDETKNLGWELLGSTEKNSISKKNKDTRSFILSDALHALDTLESENVDKQVQLFVFAVKTLYTLEMNTMYRKDEKEMLTGFIGGSIWSYQKQKRMISSSREKWERCSFEFDFDAAYSRVKDKHNSVSVGGDSRKKAAGEEVDNQGKKDDTLPQEKEIGSIEYLICGAMCRFKKKTEDLEQNLMGFNYKEGTVKLGAIFNLDFLFLSALNFDKIMKNLLNSNTDDIENRKLILEMLEKVKIIPVNVELIDRCYAECKLKKELRDSNDRKHYENFVKNVNNAVKELNVYLGALFEKEVINKEYAEIVCNVYESFCEKRKEKPMRIELLDLGRKRTWEAVSNMLVEKRGEIKNISSDNGLQSLFGKLFDQYRNKSGSIEAKDREELKAYIEQVNEAIKNYNKEIEEED